MNQIVSANNIGKPGGELVTIRDDVPDTISFWAESYFRFEVSTSERSQKEQHRDLSTFIDFMFQEEGSDDRVNWTPRLSRAYLD